jgi:hypothetical protein
MMSGECELDTNDLIALIDGLAKPLWRHVVQLFSADSDHGNRPSPLGSGVLVQHEDRTLLFSAAHVVAELKPELRRGPFWMALGEELVPFPSASCQLTGTPDMGTHEHDRQDAGVCLLPRDIPAELAARALDIRSIQPIAPTDQTRYVLLGHAANRTDVDRAAKEIASERMPLVLAELPESFYSQNGYSKDTHLMLRFRNAWKTTAGTRAARRLSGSSGGGIWAFEPGSAVSPQPAATFTEVSRIKGGKAYVGTHIALHLQLVSLLLNG